ncbi:MAG: ferrous iron transport protein A [Phycisphaerales bacterium]|nr:ferrous iron transport protein A [Phycisphaerales bacterium]
MQESLPSNGICCESCDDGASCRLHQLKVGCAGRVASVGGDRELRRRLLEMGFCNGARVQLVRRAPLGDPIEFAIRGYYVSLRAEQARHVTVAIEGDDRRV